MVIHKNARCVRNVVLRAVLVAVTLQFLAVLSEAFSIELSKSKLPWTKDGPKLEFKVTPSQPELKDLVIETLVDASGKQLLSNVKVPGDGTTFVAKMNAEPKLSAGLYKLRVSNAGADQAATASQVLQFKLVVPISIASASVNNLKLSYGEKIKNQVFSSGSNDAMKITVQLQNDVDKSSVTAHQVFLRFTHGDSGEETYFALTADQKKRHSAQLSFSMLSKKFSYNSGEHQLQLIVGDPSFQKPIVWDMGVVELHLAAAPPPTPSPLYSKPLLHDSDTTLKALPEITHIMRAQDPRPPMIVSLAFSGAVAVPFGGFLIFILRLGPNLSKLFQGSQLIFGSCFLLSIASILGLFGWYWIELTMYQTLGFLSVLGPVTLFFGRMSLKGLAAMPDLSSKMKGSKQD